MTRPPRPPRASKREHGTKLWAWHKVEGLKFDSEWFDTITYHKLYQNRTSPDYLCEKCAGMDYANSDSRSWVKIKISDRSVVWTTTKLGKPLLVPDIRAEDLVDEHWDRFPPST